MNKRELSILERAFECEVDAAIKGHGLPVMQTRSKLAEKLAEEGYLERADMKFGEGAFKVTVSGYVLTHAGRAMYCMTCSEGERN